MRMCILRSSLLLALCLACVYSNEAVEEQLVKFELPSTSDAFFAETFQETTIDGDEWVKSTVEKYSTQTVSISKSEKSIGSFKDDKALVLENPAKHYGVARKLEKSFKLDESEKELVIQYEVRLEQGLDCGGAYIKLLKSEKDLDVTTMDDQSPYIIMFGPDKCGMENKVHFIFRHQNPITKEWEEKHLEKPPVAQTDRRTHLYTLIIRDDNSFEILVDMKSVSSGSLLKDFKPAVNPPEEIDDPSDKKPEDWVDEKQIPDPEATKPEDWDEDAPMHIADEKAVKPEGWLDNEPKTIDDPEAVKPEDWDDEDDGEWEAPQVSNPKCNSVGCGEWKRPMIKNPAYKGKWSAPLIDNPAYKGEWSPRQIKNPGYFVDNHPARMSGIGAIGIEVWTMSGGIHMDNFWLGHSAENAKNFASKTWKLKNDLEVKADKESVDSEKGKIRESKLSEGGLANLAQVYAMDAVDFLANNVVVAVGILVTVFFMLIFVCCSGSKKTEEVEVAERVEEEEGEESEEDNQDEVEVDETPVEVMKEDEEVKPEDDEEKPTIRRRRAPKAD